MISQVAVRNYRSFDETRITLGPLTVLVGPNASGKSNFVDALNFVSSGLDRGLEEAVAARHGYRDLSRWSGDEASLLAIAVAVSRQEMGAVFGFALSASSVVSQGFTVILEQCDIISSGDGLEPPFILFTSPWLSEIKRVPLSVEQDRQDEEQTAKVGFVATKNSWERKPTGFPLSVGEWPEPPADDFVLRSLGLLPPYKEVLDHLRGIRIYTLSPDKLRTPQPLIKGQALSETGDNLASLLREDFPAGSESRISLLNAFSMIVDGAVDFRVRNAGSRLVIEVGHLQPGGKVHYFDAAVESDGTLRILGLLAALYQKRRPSLTIIEEPELHLHPGAMGVLVDVLREASLRGQVLVTTQSADLMNELESDELRVVEKIDGVTHIGPVDDEYRKTVEMELFTPGDLIRVEGFRRQAD